MRFTSAWASIASQNLTLKITVTCLSICVLGPAIVTLKLALKTPLLIERGCSTTTIIPAKETMTAAEMNAFLREALPIRFDTANVVKPDWLSIEEQNFREQELQDLKKRDLKQRIIINSIKFDGEKATIDSDRMLSTNTLRSALPFPLVVIVTKTSRTNSNPYGLELTRVMPGELK